MNTRRLISMAMLPGIVAATACSPYPRTESSFGDSVRHLVSSQAVATGPVDSSPVETGDGERLNAVLEALRTDVSRGDEPATPLLVDFGAGASQ